MLRLVAIVFLVLASIVSVGSAAAADCGWCLDWVVLQTRDGQPWTEGKPVTLVIHVDNQSADPLPASAQAVVMQTDGDRTKCLGVPLKLVEGDASGGLYAGLFFPFRAAKYDGKLVVGSDIQDITFDVNQMVGGAAPAGELPAAEALDTSAPLTSLVYAVQTPAAGAAAAASVVALFVYARQRRVRRPAVT